jgi:hypothetical protein
MLERPVKPRTLCLRRTNKKSGRMNMRQYTIHLLFNINLQHNHHQQSYRGTTVNTCKIVTKLRDLSSNPIQIHVVSERSDAWVILCTIKQIDEGARGFLFFVLRRFVTSVWDFGRSRKGKLRVFKAGFEYCDIYLNSN